MRKILFVHNHLSSFVRVDRDLLAEHYSIHEWYQPNSIIDLPGLKRAVESTDLVFGWFASWHTLFPVLLAKHFRKPSLLVVGGYDTANLPQIRYGNLRGGMRGRVTRTTISNATQLVVNSAYIVTEVLKISPLSPDKVAILYHGLEPGLPPAPGKDKMVITVGNVDRSTIARKGLETFVRAAGAIPNVPFVVIGSWRDDAIQLLKRIASPNVTFTGWLSAKELNNYMQRAKVYAQPSLHEGFGMAVAEAMLHECIPVITRAGSLPEVVGETGVYVEPGDPSSLAAGILRALYLDVSAGAHARARIVEKFPLENRRTGLFTLIERLLNEPV